MSRLEITAQLLCSTPGCLDCIKLVGETQHAYGLAGVNNGHTNYALELAATYLGWRRDVTPMGPLAPGAVANKVYCPKHSAELVCARCQGPTAEDGTGGCSCVHARIEAIRP